MPETSTTDRTRTPLLNLITQESMDQDYQHVAEQRAAAGTTGDQAAARASGRRGHWVATAVVGVFGLLVTVAAVQTSERSGVTSASRDSLLRQIDQRRDQAADLQQRIVRLRELNIGLQGALTDVDDDERSTTSRTQRLAGAAGFGPVSGPGLVIAVDDAPDGEAVRDEDLALLVNGLWEAGAEAISINGKRLTTRSGLRNSGAAINLNGPPPLSPPYVVSAIGDTRTLQADLIDTSTGLAFSNTADALGFPVTMKVDDDLTLPAAQLRAPRHAVKGTAEQNRRPDGKENAP
ncbi:hypothetical protein ASC77_01390 [Nocardioides sp. Root1257]|uniref:DUF881 domain-containing protein n=1 Tax=unclassified Nocardioides TaxID=2615069 RepID=UPI0006FADDCD|nr:MULTISPECIES: DUF881 domain-containing protein [unclassified Nocardioides]KQW52987.1 hypothetical protein ASC77_01390 [Nocardioides sp. Root1257]KRC55675.1 hypothetical protein ASE24_01390 [Nocardioides sp. Root224]